MKLRTNADLLELANRAAVECAPAPAVSHSTWQVSDTLVVSLAAAAPAPAWWIKVSDLDAEQWRAAYSWLDPTERQRAENFLHQADRDSFVAAHAAVRYLLGTQANVPAEQIIFDRHPCPCGAGHPGKPFAVGLDWQFSLAHTRGAIAVTVARFPVGIDIEQLPDPTKLAQVAGLLAEAEQRQIASHHQPELEFARQWTVKEALVKLTGLSLDE